MKIFQLWRKRRPVAQRSESYPARAPHRTSAGPRRRIRIPDVIQRYYVPLAVMQASDQFMRQFGREQRECYVWWGGYFTGNGNAQVVTALCPNLKTDYGHIRLGTLQLSALHSKLRELDQVLLVELHSHPPGADGQNTVDAAHPAVAYRGFVSIVVPDFGFPRFCDLTQSYVYEYVLASRWRQLTRSEIDSRFVIEDAVLLVDV
jgi:hypothetical protein